MHRQAFVGYLDVDVAQRMESGDEDVTETICIVDHAIVICGSRVDFVQQENDITELLIPTDALVDTRDLRTTDGHYVQHSRHTQIQQLTILANERLYHAHFHQAHITLLLGQHGATLGHDFAGEAFCGFQGIAQDFGRIFNVIAVVGFADGFIQQTHQLTAHGGDEKQTGVGDVVEAATILHGHHDTGALVGVTPHLLQALAQTVSKVAGGLEGSDATVECARCGKLAGFNQQVVVFETFHSVTSKLVGSQVADTSASWFLDNDRLCNRCRSGGYAERWLSDRGRLLDRVVDGQATNCHTTVTFDNHTRASQRTWSGRGHGDANPTATTETTAQTTTQTAAESVVLLLEQMLVTADEVGYIVVGVHQRRVTLLIVTLASCIEEHFVQ